jgi:hypothetical protein
MICHLSQTLEVPNRELEVDILASLARHDSDPGNSLINVLALHDRGVYLNNLRLLGCEIGRFDWIGR